MERGLNHEETMLLKCFTLPSHLNLTPLSLILSWKKGEQLFFFFFL